MGASERVGVSPLRRGLGRLRRNGVAMASAVALGAMYLAAAAAGFVAPYHYDDERRDLSYHPPSAVRVVDAEGRWRRPFVYATTMEFDAYRRRHVTEDRTRRYPIGFFVRGEPYRLFWLIPCDRHLFGVAAPARLYVAGADSRGRDLFSRLVSGSQVSLSIGLVGVCVTFTLGMFVGGLAGFYGGWADELIMRLCEMIMMIPGFYLLLALRAAFPPELSSVEVYVLIVIMMSFIGWAGLARVIRGMVLSLREREYVVAARAAGRGSVGIVFSHLLPNTVSYAVVAATLSVPGYILGESALSLLGLGIQDPHASWGNLLSEAMNVSQLAFHPWVLWPGVCIFATVMAYNFLGDGLRDAFDPRLETARR
ncbi:MAG TPA: ABC transporter permease [bacterium]